MTQKGQIKLDVRFKGVTDNLCSGSCKKKRPKSDNKRKEE